MVSELRLQDPQLVLWSAARRRGTSTHLVTRSEGTLRGRRHTGKEHTAGKNSVLPYIGRGNSFSITIVTHTYKLRKHENPLRNRKRGAASVLRGNLYPFGWTRACSPGLVVTSHVVPVDRAVAIPTLHLQLHLRLHPGNHLLHTAELRTRDGHIIGSRALLSPSRLYGGPVIASTSTSVLSLNMTMS